MLAQMGRAAGVELENATALDTLWQQIQRHLEDEKERLFQEIRSYPPPIPACDAQFNALLAERTAVLQALGAVNSVRKQNQNRSEQIELLDKLISSSQYLNDLSGELVEQVRRTLTQLTP
jgi:chorismate mutase